MPPATRKENPSMRQSRPSPPCDIGSLCANAGGMMRASWAKTRATMALFSGSPGTIGATPFRLGCNASSRRSSRIPAMRELLSGPWQRKQVPAMIGRMSRLKRTCAPPPRRPQGGTQQYPSYVRRGFNIHPPRPSLYMSVTSSITEMPAFVTKRVMPGSTKSSSFVQIVLCADDICFADERRLDDNDVLNVADGYAQ